MNTKLARVLWILSGVFLLLTGCGRPIELDPVKPNPLMEITRMCYLKDGTAVPEDITLEQGESFYCYLELAPKPDRPIRFADDEVSDPRLWGCVVTCFPLGKDSRSKEAVRYPFGTYHIEQNPRYRLVWPILARPGKHWNRATTKYIGTPKSLPLQSEKNFSHWTFFGSPFDAPGEYWYEIHVYPSFRPISLARTHKGQPLLLRRGKLTVLPPA